MASLLTVNSNYLNTLSSRIDECQVTIDGYLDKNATESNLNILETYFKTILSLGNYFNYDKKLNRTDFLDFVKSYIEKRHSYRELYM